MAGKNPEPRDDAERWKVVEKKITTTHHFGAKEKGVSTGSSLQVHLSRDKTPPDSREKKRDYVKILESAILAGHHSQPYHRGTIFVREKTDRDEILWEGPVELFGLPDHESAKNCYAWQHTGDDGKAKIVAVLENDFITSAMQAVEAAIFSDVQPSKNPNALELFRKNRQKAGETRHEAQIRTEDLAATIESLKETQERIRQRRNPAG
jgi:hypothetical protein